MPTTYTIPPDTRATGTADPANDMNAVIDALKAAGAVYNVLNAAYSGGADPTGVADSTAAIQAAITAANGLAITYIPAGTYKLSSTLTLPTGTILQGAGENATILSQTSTTVDTLTWTDKRFICLRDLQLSGPGSGTGRGIAGHFSTQAAAGLNFTNLYVVNFGGDGVYIETPITSVFNNIRSQTNLGNQFHIVGGTSCVFNSCYANAGGGIGYFISGLHYSSFNACAADTITANNNGAYFITAGLGLSFNGCGNESSVTGFKITGSSKSCVLNGCRTYNETNIAFLITGTSSNISLISPMEDSPGVGVSASIQVDTGSTAVVVNPTIVTAAIYNTGTSYVITNTGGVVH